MIAAGSTLIGDYQPTRYTTLVDPRGPRVLMSDGTHSYIVALLTGADALNAEAEKLAAAVLRSVLPQDAGFQLPVTVASKSYSAGEFSAAEATLTVTEPLPGLPLSTQAFADDPQLVESLAQVLAAVHNAEVGAVADAGLVTLEPQEVREAYLDKLDRGAQTGKIPQVLLQRWETLLETPSVWHFLPTIVHDSLSVDAIRIEAGKVVALNDLHTVRVGDPAVDVSAALDLISPADYDIFLTAYAHHRHAEDPHLEERVGLTNELAVLEFFLTAADSDNAEDLADAQAMLVALADSVGTDGGTPAEQAPAGAENRPQSAIDADAQAFRPAAPMDGDDDAEPTDVIER